ncbi:MAG: hypothetical protein NC079_06540 [Clostridium sp.]|nr:hypothetical protein [Acetatifactor muris]MCM1526383.1 hypothetical protein [Bacteroides sp.]MCM1563254.1 hypothetical protein [Clostridium sp.]
MNKNRILTKIVNHIILLLGGTLAGVLLLWLAYCLPVEPMREHVYQSLPLLEREFEAENLIAEYPGTFMGGFTDCLMLENAIYRSDAHSLWEQILCMYRGESGTGDGWATGYSLSDYLAGIPQPAEVSYARYWHGYLVVLKPLLWLTTFPSIRLVAAWAQPLLIGLVVLVCCRRKDRFPALAFLVSVPFLYYFSLFTSLSLSICFYILTIALSAQLSLEGEIRRRGWYGEFFVLVGMATAYFDFLTYPLVTLGFPLCVYLYYDRGSVAKRFRNMLLYSAEWGIGYMGLWMMKWILAEIFTGEKVIADGLKTLAARTGAVESAAGSGFAKVLWSNISPFANWGFGLLAAGIAVWLCVYIVRHRRNICRESFLGGGLLLLVALYPFVWFFLTQNHSSEHSIFTCKILALTVFAGVCAAGRICAEPMPSPSACDSRDPYDSSKERRSGR